MSTVVSDNFKEGLNRAVMETVENMAFMEISPVEDPSVKESEEEGLTVGLLVHDPVQGEFRLKMTEGLLSNIAEAIYALPPEELSEQILKDILAEIVNTFVGRFMTAILPENQTYQLGLPEYDDLEELDESQACKKWLFMIDEETFTVLTLGETLMEL